MTEQLPVVPVDQRIGGDDQVMLRDGTETLRTVGAVEDQELETGGEALGLASPVPEQTGGHDKKARPVRPLFEMSVRQKCKGLHGLAEPHVVCERAAETGGCQCLEPAEPFQLVMPQASGKSGGRLCLRRIVQCAEPVAEIPQFLAPDPWCPAPLQRLGKGHRATGFGKMESHQPLSLQEGGNERGKALPLEDRDGSVRQPRADQSAGELFADFLHDIGTVVHFLEILVRHRFDEIEDEGYEVDGMAVHLQLEGQRKPVVVGRLDRGGETDGTLMHPQRPGVLDFHLPSVSPELWQLLHEKIQRRGKPDFPWTGEHGKEVVDPTHAVEFPETVIDSVQQFLGAMLLHHPVKPLQMSHLPAPVPPEEFNDIIPEYLDVGEFVLDCRCPVCPQGVGPHGHGYARIDKVQPETRIGRGRGERLGIRVVPVLRDAFQIQADVHLHGPMQADRRDGTEECQLGNGPFGPHHDIPDHGKRDVPVDLLQIRGNRCDGIGRCRRSGSQPAYRCRLQTGLCDTDQTVLEIEIERHGKRQQCHGTAFGIAENDALGSASGHGPCDGDLPRIGPEQGRSLDIPTPGPTGVDDSANQRNQVHSVRPVVHHAELFLAVVRQLRQDFEVLQREEPILHETVVYLVGLRVGAHASVLSQPSPVERNLVTRLCVRL